MAYSHYLRADRSISRGEAEQIIEACMDFLRKVPSADLKEMLEPRDPENKYDRFGELGEAFVAKDMKRASELMAAQGGRCFLCLPRRAESFCIGEGDHGMACRTATFDGERWHPRCRCGHPGDVLAACLCMAAQEAVRDGLRYPVRFESDGDLNDLKPAIEFWKKTTGLPMPDLPFIAEGYPGQRIGMAQEQKEESAGGRMDALFEAAQRIWEEAHRKGIPEARMDDIRRNLRAQELLEAYADGRQTAGMKTTDDAWSEAFFDACIDAKRMEVRKDWKDGLKELLESLEDEEPSGKDGGSRP